MCNNNGLHIIPTAGGSALVGTLGLLKSPLVGNLFEVEVQDYYVTQATPDYSLEDHVDQATANRRATSRTAAGTLDSMSRDPMLEGLEELLAEKRAKERMPEKFPTVMALVMARTMKRVAAKYADFGLARRAKYLEKEALSALKNGQSALSSPLPTNSGVEGMSRHRPPTRNP